MRSRAGPGPSLAIQGFAGYLDEVEGRPRGQDDVLVVKLVLHVLFQTLLFVDLASVSHVEERPG